jgi:hypothetical protein
MICEANIHQTDVFRKGVFEFTILGRQGGVILKGRSAGFSGQATLHRQLF